MNVLPLLDPQLDLRLIKQVSAPRSLIWRAWTEPELLMQWFCPLPWRTVSCEIDLRVGGAFKTVMRSPQGQEHPNVGCYLEVHDGHRLVWTNSLLPGWRPNTFSEVEAQNGAFSFTATIDLSDHEGGTSYVATVQHASSSACLQHQSMGFEKGWSMALEQMLQMIERGI